jgi:nicotinamidase-related amidase
MNTTLRCLARPPSESSAARARRLRRQIVALASFLADCCPSGARLQLPWQTGNSYDSLEESQARCETGHKMRQALIVIDMQQGSFTDMAPKFDAGGLTKRLNSLAAAVRRTNGAVVFIQHDGPLGDPHHPALPGWQLLADLDVQEDDAVIRKRSCDAFLGTTLDEFLRSGSIGRLIITGSATDYCVDTTVRSALARGYATIVPRDGHTTSDRPHLSAEKIIEHHNAIWADFIAPGGPAILCPCSEAAILRGSR